VIKHKSFISWEDNYQQIRIYEVIKMVKLGKVIDLAAVVNLAYLAIPSALDDGQKMIEKYEGITAKTQIGRLAENVADFGIEYGPAIATGMIAAYVAGRLLKR
jgi:hypothetical protein